MAMMKKAAMKKPTPKKTFTATVTTEKQQNINTRTGTANMANKAKPAPRTPSKQTGAIGTKWEPMKKASTAYSPSPMTATAKKKAANRGALSNSLSKMGLKQVNLDKKAKKK